MQGNSHRSWRFETEDARMDRFVAMIWDQGDPTRQGQVNSWSEMLLRQSPKWKRVLDAPGLRVFSYHHRGNGPVVTRWQGENGIVIGVLFKRGEEKKGRTLNFDRREAAEVAASRGDTLMKKYWGNYVAIWRDAETRKTTAVRDPCAAVPCFTTRQQGIDLFFAHTEDVANFPGSVFSIDWIFLQAFILHEHFATRHTGLKEVSELLAGERMEMTSDGEQTLSWAWSGAKIATQPSFKSFDDAKHELRETMEACFTAWGKEYRRPFVQLSGGLDSSIVVNLLRHVSDTDIKALHVVGSGYEEYEVKLARLAAARAGVELIEVELDLSKEDVSRALALPRLARPATQTIGVLADELAIKAACEVDADSFMTGQAGDILFMQRGVVRHVLADYVQLHGFGKNFMRVAYGAAMLQRKSIWSVVREALANQPWQPYAFLYEPSEMKRRVLLPDVERAIPDDYVHHPWHAEAARLPPGKAGHVKNIIALTRFHPVRGHGLDYDVISSFFCQPVAELALRTPTYLLCDGGLDRALERRAFAELVPAEIVKRIGKGGFNVAAQQSVRANLPFLRTLILDGALRKQGWFDDARVEQMLTEAGVTRGDGTWTIYQLAAAEVWLRRWCVDGVRAAA
jgi:asparagine synthase (glutamine-hydrolysing)